MHAQMVLNVKYLSYYGTIVTDMGKFLGKTIQTELLCKH